MPKAEPSICPFLQPMVRPPKVIQGRLLAEAARESMTQMSSFPEGDVSGTEWPGKGKAEVSTVLHKVLVCLLEGCVTEVTQTSPQPASCLWMWSSLPTGLGTSGSIHKEGSQPLARELPFP